MKRRNYKIEYSHSSRNDIRNMKKYIIDTFKYYEYGNNFTKKMKAAANILKASPFAYGTVEFRYRGYDIRMKSYRAYLFFYIVDVDTHTITVLRVLQDGMDWKTILKYWLRDNV